MTDNLLSGIGVSGYRSFNRWQSLEFPTKVTVLAGINNSGKSNVLRLLQSVLPQLSANGRAVPSTPKLEALDAPRGFGHNENFIIGLPISLPPLDVRDDPRETIGQIRGGDAAAYKTALMHLLADDGVYWSRFELVGNAFQPPAPLVKKAMSLWPRWDAYFQNALRTMGGGTVEPRSVMAQLLTSIGGFESIPPVATIAGARHVEPGGSDVAAPGWLTGRGLISALAEVQNPPHDKWEEARAVWASINTFVQSVLGYPQATLNIPHDSSSIQVETPDRVLPLSNLGSGVEQVVILAAAATVTQNSLVCVEEPETNLHPLLQKKLIQYLTDETSNQYVIATHSSHLLDDSRATAYHVRLTTAGTVAARARRPQELVEIFHDLGYRPSDLLQANCVIWVEGPSDRIYIRHWLRLVDPSLQEGIDFSMMFYGGRLLAHLSASEEALDDFIALKRLNRSSAVVIDSDKKSPRADINSTKQRIRREFQESKPGPGFAWVTRCYTIENYIEPDVLTTAVVAAHPSARHGTFEQWENPLPVESSGPRFDKIAIAREVEANPQATSLDRFDLRRQVERLRDFIKSANGFSVAPESS